MSDSSSFFSEVKRNPGRFYIIHYSSQSLYDEGVERGGMSPRITSIVVMHLSTRQTVTFAMHAIAEEMRISKDDVEGRYDEIERAILTRFYSFARDRREKHWIHWNMRNVVFGFEHLEHRFRVLTGEEPPAIPVEVRRNLNDILKDRYGPGFAPDPRMLGLMLLNGDRDPRFLSGPEEAEAFAAKDFIRMHSSTISKVEFFRHVIELAQRGQLKTASKGFYAWMDRMLESRGQRLFAFIATAVGLIVGVLGLVLTIRSVPL
jgi:hypothetical protein